MYTIDESISNIKKTWKNKFPYWSHLNKLLNVIKEDGDKYNYWFTLEDIQHILDTENLEIIMPVLTCLLTHYETPLLKLQFLQNNGNNNYRIINNYSSVTDKSKTRPVYSLSEKIILNH